MVFMDSWILRVFVRHILSLMISHYNRLLSHIIPSYIPYPRSYHPISIVWDQQSQWTFPILYDVESIPNIISSVEIFVGIPVGHQRILKARQCGSSLLLQRADPRKFLDASVGTAA